jgi:hypothetical protein
MILLTGREKSDLTVNKACWSSGQDATLSRWKQGFDPPTGYHIFVISGLNQWVKPLYFIKGRQNEDKNSVKVLGRHLMSSFFILLYVNYYHWECLLDD